MRYTSSHRIVGLESPPHTTIQIQVTLLQSGPCLYGNAHSKVGQILKLMHKDERNTREQKYVENCSALQKGDLFGFIYTQVM